MVELDGFSKAAGRVSEGAGRSQKLAGTASDPTRRPRKLEQKENTSRDKAESFSKCLTIGDCPLGCCCSKL